MVLGSYFVNSPRMSFSTENYNEWMNKLYHKSDDDDGKTIPKWFYSPYCDECEKNRVCT